MEEAILSFLFEHGNLSALLIVIGGMVLISHLKSLGAKIDSIRDLHTQNHIDINKTQIKVESLEAQTKEMKENSSELRSRLAYLNEKFIELLSG